MQAAPVAAEAGMVAHATDAASAQAISRHVVFRVAFIDVLPFRCVWRYLVEEIVKGDY